MIKIYKLFFLAIFLGNGVQSFAQTTFELIPSEMTPESNGFYTAGLTFDFDGNGIPEYENGCPTVDVDPEDYERRDPFNVTYDAHNENGEQFGFTYRNAMILPDCDHKYIDDLEQIDPPVSHGFVQLRPNLDTSDVDVAYSYIQSPYLSNLVSVTFEISADISIQTSRQIPYQILYSKDSGETFVDNYYILEVITTRSGTRATFDNSDPDFAQMITDSKSSNVMLRFTTNLDDPDLKEMKGQYLNVHKISIVADSSQAFENNGGGNEGPLGNIDNDLPAELKIQNGAISVQKGDIAVYRISGQFVGRGQSVSVGKGLFIVTSETLGIRKKIFIK
ncbi:hypothetical protein [Marinoscillum sp. MHG1-6]|uniref:hypothetical protein n=1 Tax=Marinoscillum sp. MHG1-6 TaxID=2959627 RepID=UPI002156FC6F|nr:hypothetical protein [Marinoscillum sp. MHG1-6]